MRKLTVLVAAITVMLAGSAQPAHAFTWTGTCSLTLQFNFHSPVQGVGILPWVTTPSYSIWVQPATDLNALTGEWEACAIEPDVFNPLRTTNAWGDGSSSLWTCEETVANGSWNQNWPSAPPAVWGAHQITGGPDGWTMTVHNWPAMNFAGSMQLSVHPSDPFSIERCELYGTNQLTMIGVMEFQYQ
jgi:hypothetical protein